ncbi:M20/M25/M40 family metallo-hydrolase [Nannocystis pusilla]|uniref:M20/M25/M40 family metallo-hydrolase n=1 Tax=Nannocystis pusilla TaxID=889268 RepID=A0A9X3IWC0_9BACT|nr:M20/M25/M40 family metallo-hydrolase [Nannocystis pusilla]
MCVVGEPTSQRAPGDTIKIGRCGRMCGTVRVRGVQGHGAYPDRADNHLARLIRFLSHLGETPLDHGSLHFAPSSVSITSIDGSNAATHVTPGQAQACFDVRFNDCHTRASLESRLRRLAAAQLHETHELELRCDAEPFLCAPGRWHEALAHAAYAVVGRRPEFSTSGETSDARFIHPYCPVVELGLVGTPVHRADEHVSLADLDSLTAIYTLMLAGFVRVAAH